MGLLDLGAEGLPKARFWDTHAKNARALVVVNNTAAIGRENLRWLYHFVEASGDAVAHTLLGPCYGSVTSLNGSNATTDALCAALSGAARRPEVKGIDLILNMHGTDGRLYFFETAEGGLRVSDLQARLSALGLGRKLRLAYSTCCYGASHNAALCGGGFRAAIGAAKVNTNSASEYPVLLANWAAGRPIAEALAKTQGVLLREPFDLVARKMGFPDADSAKTLSGEAALTIESE